ncbi:MAG: S24 family peptidase [Jatrophihabitans sp.]
MRYLIPWQFIRVAGSSMTPSLLPDDVVLVRHNAPVVAGDVVLARFRSRPQLNVVKRAAVRTGAGWTVVSDNAVGIDSTTYGPADVLAVARWVVPGKARRRLAAAGAFADDRSRLAWLAERLPRRVASQELS